MLQNVYATPLASRQCFPLELIICCAGKEKLTSDTWEAVSFGAYCQLAHKALVDRKILTDTPFNVVVWEMIYDTSIWSHECSSCPR
jgi:hypothetical protein